MYYFSFKNQKNVSHKVCIKLFWSELCFPQHGRSFDQWGHCACWMAPLSCSGFKIFPFKGKLYLTPILALMIITLISQLVVSAAVALFVVRKARYGSRWKRFCFGCWQHFKNILMVFQTLRTTSSYSGPSWREVCKIQGSTLLLLLGRNKSGRIIKIGAYLKLLPTVDWRSWGRNVFHSKK